MAETQRSARREVEILLVEDNPGDVRLTKEALAASKICNRVHVVSDGEQAMAFLRREGSYVGAPRPDLILLDLNLPRKDGRQVLSEMKAHEDLKCIPVVVLTTSGADTDVMGAYGLHANAYIVKPIDLDQFVRVVRSLESFWFAIVTLPPR